MKCEGILEMRVGNLQLDKRSGVFELTNLCKSLDWMDCNKTQYNVMYGEIFACRFLRYYFYI